MYKVKTMNAIARQGLDVLTEAGLDVNAAHEAPEGLLIRSAAIHDMEFNPELLCVGRAGIGVDNIPIDRCTEAGIAVFNTPGANAESVKELLTCALMMASRDVIGAIEWVNSLAGQGAAIPSLVEKGKKQFIGPEISGKKLGVIGLGTIGSKVAYVAQKLDMEVYGYDPYLSVASAWNLSSKVRRVTDLDMMLRTCDYITMHIHYTPQTRHYLNAERFAKMKPGMRVLNLSRGELVDDDAMLAALESGQVARYVTDFPNEKLVGRKNVVCMPHIGASTPEAEDKCAIMGAQEVRDYLLDGNILNSVNLPNAYLDRVGQSRLCIIHKNQPKMLNQFLEMIADENINVEHMLNKARGDIAYTIFDTNTQLDDCMAQRMAAVPGVVRVRLIH